jgi:predicted DCC family thiol-disulfide oxidoreductase YuxK
MRAYEPEKDFLLLFDGVCHLCDGAVKFVLRHDRSQRIRFTSIQSELGQRLYTQHGLDPQAMPSFLFITPSGPHMAGDAVIEVCRVMGGVWSLAVLGKILPKALRDAAYGLVAKNRYRWFGREDACMLPTPELRERMLA